MKLTALLSCLGLLLVGAFAQAQAQRRPPERPPKQSTPPPTVPRESDFFSVATAMWTTEKPTWVNKDKPIIIGLSAGRFPMEMEIQNELKKFALKMTRNVLVIQQEGQEPPKDVFKNIASSAPHNQRYRWLWLEAGVASLSLAWFHCWNPVCFEGSKAETWVELTEINPLDGSEWVIGSCSNFLGHFHVWARDEWMAAGAPPNPNLYYFTGGLLLRLQLQGFEQYLKATLNR